MSNHFIPATYREINYYNGSLSPSTVHIKNSGLAQFFKRYLLQEAMSVFDWTMPEEWDKAYFLYVLYLAGNIGIIKTKKFGVIPQHGTLGGRNVFYAPHYYNIANPLFDRAYRLIIDQDCTVLRLEPDYFGLFDMVDYYGDMMALAAEAVGVNLVNSKLSFVFAAKNKAAAESFKQLYDEYAEGNPASFADKNLFDEDGKLLVQMFSQDVGGNFIVPELLDALRVIRCMFLTDCGIPNANIMKQSGVGASEVTANNFETRAKCGMWLEELRKGCRKAREMFPGLELDVDWRKELREVYDDEGNISVNSVDLPL